MAAVDAATTNHWYIFIDVGVPSSSCHSDDRPEVLCLKNTAAKENGQTHTNAIDKCCSWCATGTVMKSVDEKITRDIPVLKQKPVDEAKN